MIIGLDIGYGYTKVATNNNRLFIFKTAVSRYIPDKIWGNNANPVVVNKNQYLVGEEATEHIIGNVAVSDDFVGTDEYYAIIAKVLENVAIQAKVLVLGLPPGLYTENRTTELVKKFRSIEMQDKQGNAIPLPQNIIYIPQGSGIYFSHILGGYSGDFHINVAVIDIGYYTLDAVCFTKGRFLDGAAKSYPAGSKFLIDRVKEAFGRHYGSFISDSLCEALLKNGKISHFGKEYSLDTKSIINQYYHDQVMKAIKDYANSLKQYGTTIDKVIIGGGSVIWAPEIKGAVLVSNPQMANAIGYMKYGQFMVENRSIQ